MAIVSSIEYAHVMEALKSEDPADIAGYLSTIGNQGESAALSQGYAHEVAAMLHHGSPEVQAAACYALSNMGKASLGYIKEIASLGTSDDANVRYAVASSLGGFGKEALVTAEQVLQGMVRDEDELVRIVAIIALGEVQAISKARLMADLLNDSSLQVVAAAIQALGLLGQDGEDHADNIAKHFDNDQTRYAAVVAFSNFSESSVSKYANTIIEKCLTDPDLMTRQAASVAIGNMAESVLSDSANVDKIVDLLSDTDPAVRCAAAAALGNMGEKAKDHADKLLSLLDDQDEDLSWLHLQMGGGSGRALPSSRLPRAAALVALGQMGAEDQAEQIATKLTDDVWEVRLCALDALQQFTATDASRDLSNVIAEALNDDVFMVRAKACEVIGTLKCEDQATRLAEKFEDSTPAVRTEALMALAQMPDAAGECSSEVFSVLNKDTVTNVRAAAIHCLGSMGEIGQSYASIIASFLWDPDTNVRASTCEALGKLDAYGAAFAEEVSTCLSDGSPTVRAASAKSLGRMGEAGRQYLGQMQALQDEEDDSVREAAKNAVIALDGTGED